MPRQLYMVDLYYPLVVLAESEEEAATIAKANVKNESPDYNVHPLQSLCNGWSLNCMPYTQPYFVQKTIEEWISLRAAPDYNGEVH